VNVANPNGEPEGYAATRTSRIEQTVARDLARRRRMVRAYLALLIVPLAVAAAFLVFGRTDRRVVEEEVEEQVAPVWQSYREIEPMLTEVRGVGELLPSIRGVDERIERYERGQSELSERVAAVAADVRELEPIAAAGREAREQVTELRRDWEAEKRQLSRRIDAFEMRLDPAAGEGPAGRRPGEGAVAAPTFERLSGRTDAIERQQAELARQVTLLSAGSRAERPASEVDALERRLQELERTVESLEQEVRRLRAELSRYSPPR